MPDYDKITGSRFWFTPLLQISTTITFFYLSILSGKVIELERREVGRMEKPCTTSPFFFFLSFSLAEARSVPL